MVSPTIRDYFKSTGGELRAPGVIGSETVGGGRGKEYICK